MHILHGRLQVFIEAEYVALPRSNPCRRRRPASPVTTIARTSSSSLARLKASINSLAIATVKELSCSRPVQREGEDVVGHFVAQGVVGHGGFSFW